MSKVSAYLYASQQSKGNELIEPKKIKRWRCKKSLHDHLNLTVRTELSSYQPRDLILVLLPARQPTGDLLTNVPSFTLRITVDYNSQWLPVFEIQNRKIIQTAD
jgi:hypothetical protein